MTQQQNAYKILLHDRLYTKWDIHDVNSFNIVESLKVDPSKSKLFTNDIFEVDDSGNVTILHSTVRSSTSIPGVLMIDGNKTYGRDKKNNKLLYKCVPDDTRLPPFLIPYEIKNVGFSKVFINLYVTFHFKSWDDKHPKGVLDQSIGPVDVLDNFYEYQLYCKSLNASIQHFQKETVKALENVNHENFIESVLVKYPTIEDRRQEFNVFTIDPYKSVDFDDGFSIKSNIDGTKQLSIYIANVTILMDVLNLWDSFSRRISTIYLPDRKRPMLPTMLSDCLCSLQANNSRIAFVMDILISRENEVIDIKYSNCLIKVYKNYVYEEESLLHDKNYTVLIDVVKQLSRKFKYINNVRNSHEVVCYLMIFMNYHCATEMMRHSNGIFRCTTTQPAKQSFEENVDLPDEVNKFIKIWNSSTGQYAVNSCKRHDLLGLESYIHITSPIRRLVDLLNIIKFQQNSGMISLSSNSASFYDKWVADIDYINVTMRSIRKVQVDCELLDACANNPDILMKEFNGYLFDKVNQNDGLYQYVVYLPDLKLSSRVTLRENLNNYECRQFKLFLFNNEEKSKKKIRLNLISN
jgi:exoribonuclease R